MWALFLAPWAATCLSKKVGLQVSLIFMALHYGYRAPVLEAIFELLNQKNHRLTQRDHGTQTDTEAARCSSEKPEEGPCEMETHEPPRAQKGYAKPQEETPLTIGGYNCYMHAVKRV
jgi:hypothetical protein